MDEIVKSMLGNLAFQNAALQVQLQVAQSKITELEAQLAKKVPKPPKLVKESE